MIAWLLVWACAAEPGSFADCAGLGDPTAREECRFTFAKALLDQPAELDAALASIDQVDSRDLLLLRLAVAEPTKASHLCRQVQTAPALEKCRQVIGRPHLSTTPQAPQAPPDR